jgi:hypothetical protein
VDRLAKIGSRAVTDLLLAVHTAGALAAPAADGLYYHLPVVV